jgi:hypothetical protein
MNLQEQIRRILKEEVESVDMKTTQSELTNILGPSKIKNGNRVEHKHNFGSFDSSFNIVVDRLDQKTLVVINNFMTKKGWFPTSVGLSGMKQHTYSNSVQNYIGKDDVEIGYEVKIGKEINLKQSKVYHVTPDTFVDSIIKNGINLKSESKLGDHPERIYLYLNKNNSKDMVTTLWNSLSQERKKIIKNYYVLEIDLSQIPNHKFYNDPASMVTLEAIYTNQPIPKSAVNVIDKINTNSLKTYDEDKIMTPEQEREEREKRKRKEEEKIKKEKEDSIRDSEHKKSYEQIPDDIKNMSIDDLFESKNLQEQISRIQSMMGTINETKFFKRRVTPEEVANNFSLYDGNVFFDTDSYEEFKYQLVLNSLEDVMWKKYNMGWEELPEQEEIDYVNQVAEMYDDKIRNIYNKWRFM